jgi:hypothetical protein
LGVFKSDEELLAAVTDHVVGGVNVKFGDITPFVVAYIPPQISVKR